MSDAESEFSKVGEEPLKPGENMLNIVMSQSAFDEKSLVQALGEHAVPAEALSRFLTIEFFDHPI